MSLSKDIFKFAFRENPLPLVITDENGMILEVSDALLEELELTREAIIGTAVYPLIGNKELNPGSSRAVSLKKKNYQVNTKNYEVEGIVFRIFVFKEILEIKHANPKTKLIEVLLRNSYKIENFPKFISINLKAVCSKTGAEGGLFLTKDPKTGLFKPIAYHGMGEKLPKKLTVKFENQDNYISGAVYKYEMSKIPKFLDPVSILMQWNDLSLLIFIPLSSDGHEPDAMFILAYRDPSAISDDDIATLKILALIFNLFHEKSKLKKELSESTYRDFITRSYSQIMLKEFISLIFSQAKRYHFLFSIVLLKVTNYPDIKRIYGANIAELTMQKISSVLLKTLRKSDVVGKYTEDSFLFILPFTHNGGSEIAVKRVKDALMGTSFTPVKSVDFAVSIAHLEESDTKAEDILQRLKISLTPLSEFKVG